MDANKQIKDGAYLIILYIVMLLFAIYVPSSFIVIMFFMPIPFVILATRLDIGKLIIMLLIVAFVSLLMMIIVGNLLVPPLFVLSASGGTAIGMAISKRKSPYETWIQGTIGFIIGLLFAFLFSQFVLDMNWQHEIDQMLEESFELSKELIGQFGSSEQIEEQFEVIEERMAIMKDLIPVGIALIAIGMAFITQWLSYRILGRLENKRYRFPPIRKLKFPVAVVWVYIIALVVTLFESDPTSGLNVGAQNVLALASFLMIIQGFSFIFFYVHHKKKSNVLPIIAIILSFLIPFLLYLIRILGIIDMGFSLREQMQNSKGDKKG